MTLPLGNSLYFFCVGDNMFINEVENIVGLSKKSIRYYEENGLLNPKRKENSKYRIYSEDDIRKLKTIKFLRELDVSIRELKLLNDQEITLKECLEDKIIKIEKEEENYHSIKDMCKEIILNEDDFDNIDINKYFQKIKVLNKEGFTMNKKSTDKGRQIMGAILATLPFYLVFILILIGFIYSFKNIGVLLLSIIILLFIIAITVNLINRIKEILGGEEDEASKY